MPLKKILHASTKPGKWSTTPRASIDFSFELGLDLAWEVTILPRRGDRGGGERRKKKSVVEPLSLGRGGGENVARSWHH